MHRFFSIHTLVLGVVVSVFSLGSAATASAAEMRIISVECRNPQEDSGNGDEMRLTIQPDIGPKVMLRRDNMKRGTVWAVNRTFAFKSSASFQLTELDTAAEDGLNFRDENFARITVFADKTPTGVVRQSHHKAHDAHYVINYELIASSGFRLEILSLRCVREQEKDSDGDEIDLYLKVDNHGESANSTRFKGMKAGSSRNVSRAVTFFRTVRIRLMEVDGFGLNFRDEELGIQTANTTVGTFTKQFNGHGALYVLTYRVTKK